MIILIISLYSLNTCRLFEVPTTVFSFILVTAHCNIKQEYYNISFLFIFLMNIWKASQQDVYTSYHCRNSHTSVLLSLLFFFFFLPPARYYIRLFYAPACVYIYIKQYLPHPFHPCYIPSLYYYFRFDGLTRQNKHTAWCVQILFTNSIA